MRKIIPGMREVEGREFFYIQIIGKEDFTALLDDVLALTPQSLLPSDGGVIEEKVNIVINDKTTLLGISYKGDLVGWKSILSRYCDLKFRKWGIASHQILHLSDGTQLFLSECIAVFDE